MFLHALELCDVGRFGRLRVSLAGRQVGVLGPNGAGKSTILSAIHYAVTGDLGRLGGKTDAVNTARRHPGETPHVRLDFYPEGEAVDDPAIVIRRLPADGKDGTRRLTHADRTWTAQADLTDRFERWTGLPAKALSEFVFVPQGGLDQVVRAQPARRAEILQRVFGVSHADRVDVAARDALARLPLGADSGVLATLRSAAAEALGAADEAEARLAEAPRPDPHTDADCRRVIASYVEARAAAEARTAAAAAVARVEESRPSLPAEQPIAPEVVLAAKRARTEAAEWAARAERAEAARREVDRLETELRRLETSPPPTPGPDLQPSLELQNLRDRKFALAVMAEAPDDASGCCPVCAGPLPADAATRGEAADRLTELGKLEAAHASVVARQDAARRTYAYWLQAVQSARTTANRAAVAARAAQDAVGPEPDISWDEADQVLLRAAAADAELRAYLTAHGDYVRRLDRAKQALASCPIPVPVSDEAYASAKAELARQAELHAAREVLRVRAETLREAADAAVETVRRAEALSRTATATIGWRARVEEVRRVFHRDAAPAAAVRACLDGLSTDLNRRLGHLAAAFRVRMGQDGDLYASYADGTSTRTVPADRVSGGEGCVLGLAWRLALLDRYAPKVGLLCLDEPTTGLDAERVAALKSALEAWRPHGTGRQFVIVTHERKLLSVFDAVVDLDAG